MKRLIIVLVVLIFATGCRTTKKATELKSETSNKIEVAQKADTKEETKVDNDKASYKKTTITEIEYFATGKPIDEPAEVKQLVALIEPKSAVKVIKTTIIEEGTEDKTKTKTIKTDNSEISTETEGKIKSLTTVKEKSKVPVQWWAIFGILVIVVVGFIYLKMSGGLGFITKLFK